MKNCRAATTFCVAAHDDALRPGSAGGEAAGSCGWAEPPLEAEAGSC